MEDGGRLERGGERAWEWEMENRMARKYRLEEGIGVTLYVEVMKIEEITLSIVNVKYYSVVKS